jgi:bifunctional DNase/RNase
MTEDYIPLTIVDVQLDAPGVADAGLVLLQERPPPHRYLRIIVGRYEASAIARAFHGAPQPRPLPWDLYLETLDLLRTALIAVTITRAEEGRHFFAEIELQPPVDINDTGVADGSVAPVRHRLDARPSDALALAARRDWVAIRATPEVLASAGIPPVLDEASRADETELN